MSFIKRNSCHKKECTNPNKAKKRNTLASGNEGDEKNLYPSGRNFFFLINLIEFFKKHLDLKNYSNSTFLYGKSPPF